MADMNKKNKLKKAFSEIEKEEFNKFECVEGKDFEFSEEFDENIHRIAKRRNSPLWKITSTKKGKIILTVISVVLAIALLMCIPPVRKAVSGGFIKIFNPTMVSDVYAPSFFPDKTWKITEKSNKNHVCYTKWESGDNFFSLRQQDNEQNFDKTGMTGSEIFINGKKTTVFYSYDGDIYTYVWLFDGYLFNATTNKETGIDNTRNMISSIKK